MEIFIEPPRVTRASQSLMGGDVMTKRIVFALLLAFAALSATTPVWADTESGSGIVGTQSP